MKYTGSKMVRVSLLLFFMFFSMIQITSESDNDEKHVLFLNSYNWGYDLVPGQFDGVRSILEENHITYDIEFMDSKRFDDQENYDRYFAFLKYRIDNSRPYDAILCSDDNALLFLMKYDDQLVKGTPVVFFGINDSDRVLKATQEYGYYGLLETTSIKENLDLATALLPKADEFLLVTDDTTTGKGDVVSYMKYKEQYPDMTFTVVDFSTYQLEEFKTWLTTLQSNQILIHLGMLLDADGNQYNTEESIQILVDNASVPIFRPAAGGMGKGIVGGFMKSYFKQGQIAATTAVKIMNGEELPKDRLIRERPNEYTVDYKVLKANHLDIKALPKGTVMINAPVSLAEKLQPFLVPLLSSVVVLFTFLIFLAYDNRRRRIIQVELSEKNSELTCLSEELVASEEELQSQNEELIDSQKKLMESETRYKNLSRYDALTGLRNRSGLMRELTKILDDRYSFGEIYFIDLDQFKYINDSCGHQVGDQVLKIIGMRIQKFESSNIIASRIGGDEFIVIVKNYRRVKQEISLDKELSKRIEELLTVDHQEFYVSCSIGVVRYPEHGNDVEELIRKADIAMYQAKANGRGRSVIFNDIMEIKSTSILGMQNNIRHAIESNEFQLFFQPQVDLYSERTVGFEALIRWHTSKDQWIPPVIFIPLSEQLGIIHHIGSWVLENACNTLKAFIGNGYEQLKISVNVSAMEVSRANFANDFLRIISNNGLSPSQIVMELTETVLLEISENHLEKLKYLRSHGVRIHLDDFGTGYSSLSYLRKLPIDTLKIDREFIMEIVDSTEQRLLLKSIIEIAHNLNMSVIAEGVETEEQIQVLREIGCNEVQGYYYAKPMNESDAFRYLKDTELIYQ